MRPGLGAGLGLLGRPVSDKLGPEAGWAGLTGLASSLVSDTSGRPGHQEVMLFSGQKWTRRAPADMGGGGGGGGRPGGGWGRGKAKILFGEEI